MRSLILTSVALAALAASAAEPAQSYPLWDGQETIAEYAKKTGLEPTKTLDLGNGVKLELVLIPAGKFVMGTEEPKPVDEAGFRQKIIVGMAFLFVSGGLLLVLIGTVIIRAVRQRHRPQYSLAWLLIMTVAAGVALLGGLHWRNAEQAFVEAKGAYMASYPSEELPAHEVTLTQALYMGKYEVTQEQYQQVMGNNHSWFKGRDLPVDQVLWEEAKAFCQKASEKEGMTIRLPTEAEWEYACRAGTRTRFYSGDADTDLGSVAWYADSDSGTHPVGTKAPNAWGAHDMYGNLFEWCSDWYGDYEAKAATDPKGPAQGSDPVLRGGCFASDSGWCRSAFRHVLPPGQRNNGVGFRVAASIPPKP